MMEDSDSEVNRAEDIATAAVNGYLVTRGLRK